MQKPLNGHFDGAVSLDVIEHIPKEREHDYMNHIVQSLENDAIFIVGTPNVSASPHASKNSRDGHINLKNESDLRSLFDDYFENILFFGMNDEMIHTGFSPMSHFLFIIGIGKKNR